MPKHKQSVICKHQPHRRCVISPAAPLATLLGTLAATLTLASAASAGTYPMYQCSSGHPAVAPGWSVYGADTTSTTILSNTCGVGGAIGLYVYANNIPGEFTNNAPGGGSVGLSVNVDGPPDVTIAAISAHISVSPNSGDDAFLGFNSAGVLLPGMVELPYGVGSPYTTSESWTLPSGATNFTAFVNCSTDRSQSACYFPSSTEVPALNDITLTLVDDTPPTLSAIGGTLATAAAHEQSVAANQTLGFTAGDSDSGVRSATITLTPLGAGTPYTKTFDFSGSCSYEAWNACSLSQSVAPLTIPTASLKDGAYALTLTDTDAAGNETTDSLGTISSDNAPTNSAAPGILETGEIQVGSILDAQPGSWSAPSEAGPIAYSYQWERCDATGGNCQQIADAQSSLYATTQADAGHTLRVTVTATDNDGSASAPSPATAMIPAPQKATAPQPAPTSATATSESSSPTPPTSGGANTPAAASTNTVGAGAANGSAASVAAQIHLNAPNTIARTYATRAFTISGHLLDSHEQPIVGASLDILERLAGNSQARLIGHTDSANDGSFAVHVPAGPSRTIIIAYRAFTGDIGYATQTSITETVGGRVRLHITPRNTAPAGTITLAGQVQRPIPANGVIVELLVHYHGAWQPFRTPRTDRYGRFHVRYQFQGAHGAFPFRAEVPGGQEGFPYARGCSNVVDVRTE